VAWFFLSNTPYATLAAAVGPQRKGMGFSDKGLPTPLA
jgi:hypothetical protein